VEACRYNAGERLLTGDLDTVPVRYAQRAHERNAITQVGQSCTARAVKELTCLYGIAQLARQPDKPLEGILQGIVELLPGAWQYPESAAAQLTFRQKSYARVISPTLAANSQQEFGSMANWWVPLRLAT